MNRGSCLCGAVQFEAGPFDSMVHCHCSMCRKHHGAMFATFLGGPGDGFRWLAGEEAVVVYRSSEHGLRPFCRICGSVLPAVLPDLGIVLRRPPATSRATRTSGRSCTCSPRSRAGLVPDHRRAAAIRTLPARIRRRHGRRPAVRPTPIPGIIQRRLPLRRRRLRAERARRSACRTAIARAAGARAAPRMRRMPSSGASSSRGSAAKANIMSFALPGAKRFGQDFCRRCGSPVPRVVASTGYVVVPCGGLDTAPDTRRARPHLRRPTRHRGSRSRTPCRNGRRSLRRLALALVLRSSQAAALGHARGRDPRAGGRSRVRGRGAGRFRAARSRRRRLRRSRRARRRRRAEPPARLARRASIRQPADAHRLDRARGHGTRAGAGHDRRARPQGGCRCGRGISRPTSIGSTCASPAARTASGA